jgi:hypothetical protein
MSKGEKRSGLNATVGGLRRIVQLFRVAINAKGGDFWHVYRQSVLVNDGKDINDGNDINDVGRFTGRVCIERTTTKTQKVYRNNVDGKDNNNVGRFTGRVCIERTTTKTHKVYRKSVHGKNNNEDTEEQAQEAQEE